MHGIPQPASRREALFIHQGVKDFAQHHLAMPTRPLPGLAPVHEFVEFGHERIGVRLLHFLNDFACMHRHRGAEFFSGDAAAVQPAEKLLRRGNWIKRKHGDSLKIGAFAGVRKFAVGRRSLFFGAFCILWNVEDAEKVVVAVGPEAYTLLQFDLVAEQF